MAVTRRLLVLVAAAALAAGCSTSGRELRRPAGVEPINELAPTTAVLKVGVNGIGAQGLLPDEYTSGNRSPGMTWNDVPGSAKSLAVLVDMPDQKLSDQSVVWMVLNVPVSQRALTTGIKPPGIERRSWNAPLPTDADQRVRFRVYALRSAVSGASNTPVIDLVRRLESQKVAVGEVIGTIGKQSS